MRGKVKIRRSFTVNFLTASRSPLSHIFLYYSHLALPISSPTSILSHLFIIRLASLFAKPYPNPHLYSRSSSHNMVLSIYIDIDDQIQFTHDMMMAILAFLPCSINHYPSLPIPLSFPSSHFPQLRFDTQTNSTPDQRFSWLPFGHGSRSCIGRRLAELELYVILLRLSREFEMSPMTTPDGKWMELGVKTTTVLEPVVNDVYPVIFTTRM